MPEGIKTTVIFSYNSVDGFRPGWYKGARLFVHSIDEAKGIRWGSERCGGENSAERAFNTMRDLRRSFYRELNMPIEDVSEVYIYFGENTMISAFSLVSELKSKNPKARLVIVSCKCSWKEKLKIVADVNNLSRLGVEMLPCECGGQHFLGRLAKSVIKA